ncbi:hypothetical protein B0H13DRAFT_2368878 [Mycena leptocephala]|nr:hypothetical protein B0H13DRAFT_2368878 [Mycena leptocephala]
MGKNKSKSGSSKKSQSNKGGAKPRRASPNENRAPLPFRTASNSKLDWFSSKRVPMPTDDLQATTNGAAPKKNTTATGTKRKEREYDDDNNNNGNASNDNDNNDNDNASPHPKAKKARRPECVLSPSSKRQKKSTIARYEQESESIRINPKPPALIPEKEPQNELAPAPAKKTAQKKTVQPRPERPDSPLRQLAALPRKTPAQPRPERPDSPLRQLAALPRKTPVQRHQELQEPHLRQVAALPRKTPVQRHQELQEPPRGQRVYRSKAATARDLQSNIPMPGHDDSEENESPSRGATHPRRDADNEGGRTPTDDHVHWGPNTSGGSGGNVYQSGKLAFSADAHRASQGFGGETQTKTAKAARSSNTVTPTDDLVRRGSNDIEDSESIIIDYDDQSMNLDHVGAGDFYDAGYNSGDLHGGFDSGGGSDRMDSDFDPAEQEPVNGDGSENERDDDEGTYSDDMDPVTGTQSKDRRRGKALEEADSAGEVDDAQEDQDGDPGKSFSMPSSVLLMCAQFATAVAIRKVRFLIVYQTLPDPGVGISVLGAHHNKNRPNKAPNPVALERCRNRQQQSRHEEDGQNQREGDVDSDGDDRNGNDNSDGNDGDDEEEQQKVRKPRTARAEPLPPKWAKPLIHLHLLTEQFLPSREELKPELVQIFGHAMHKVDISLAEQSPSTFLEPEYYKNHYEAMIQLLWEEVAHYRGASKTLTRAAVDLYSLEPNLDEFANQGLGQAEYQQAVATKIADLIDGAAFLTDGKDDEGRTNNFSHKAIGIAIENLLFNSPNSRKRCVGMLFADKFKPYGKHLVAAACTLLKNVFDEKEKGLGYRVDVKLTCDQYREFYDGCLEGIDNVFADEHHRPKTVGRWRAWHTAAYAVRQPRKKKVSKKVLNVVLD